MIVLHRYERQAQTLQATTLLQEDDRTDKCRYSVDRTQDREMTNMTTLTTRMEEHKAQETGIDGEHRRK